MIPSRTLHMVSLGCPKNRVDSEVMLGAALEKGYRVVDDPSSAYVILVNTCGFIDAAKKESIDVILSLARFKKEGACRKLIVSGCLVQRYASELASDIPEIDHLLGSGDLPAIRRVLDGSSPRIAVGKPGYLVRSSDPRVVSTTAGSAYVKIAEGCDRKCSFCVIPAIRGKHRSRPIIDVVREVKWLSSLGVREINLVSQDTLTYGRDLGGTRKDLAELVRKLADISGIRWVRLLYLYPDRLDDALLELLAEHPNVVPYVDMPMQHASDRLLRSMARGHNQSRLRKTVERLRARVPVLTLRTAFIVGFPGETDHDFAELCDFVRWARFERMGVFRYSDEEGTPSYAMGEKVAPRTSYNRARRLMALQRPIARAHNRELVGRVLEVLVDGPSEQHEWVMAGRHRGQAPEIDGVVYLTESEVRAGEIRQVKITRATDYDLVGEAVDEAGPQEAKPRRRLAVV